LSCGTDQACPEQVELCSPIALAFDKLEAGNLALDLAAAPGQRQGCAHGLLVLTQAGGEAAQFAVLGIGQPRGERIRRAGANQGAKAEGEVARRGQRWRQPQQPLDIGVTSPFAQNCTLGWYMIAVGTPIAERPPHRSVRADCPHTALTLGV